jgi:hypothetical protein
VALFDNFDIFDPGRNDAAHAKKNLIKTAPREPNQSTMSFWGTKARTSSGWKYNSKE